MGVGNHGFWFLVGLALFPPITLLLFATTTFGWLAWLGWLIAPHFLVAILSLGYWNTHPVLVVIACIMAFAGTGGEAETAIRKAR